MSGRSAVPGCPSCSGRGAPRGCMLCAGTEPAPLDHHDDEFSDRVKALAEIIWTTSRADESTISATGANIVAAAVLDAGYRPVAHRAGCNLLQGCAPGCVASTRLESEQ